MGWYSAHYGKLTTRSEVCTWNLVFVAVLGWYKATTNSSNEAAQYKSRLRAALKPTPTSSLSNASIFSHNKSTATPCTYIPRLQCLYIPLVILLYLAGERGFSFHGRRLTNANTHTHKIPVSFLSSPPTGYYRSRW